MPLGALLPRSSRLACAALVLALHGGLAAPLFLSGAPLPPAAPTAIELTLVAAMPSDIADDLSPAVVAEVQNHAQSEEAAPGDVVNTIEGTEQEIEVADTSTASVSARLRQSAKQAAPIEQEMTAAPAKARLAELPPQRYVEAARVAEDVEPAGVPAMVEADGSPEATDPARQLSVIADTPALADGEVKPDAAPAAAAIPRRQVEVAKPKREPRKTPDTKQAAKPKPKDKVAEAKRGSRKTRVASTAAKRAKPGLRDSTSRALASGGRVSASAYRAIVQSRIAARRGMLSAVAGGAGGTVDIRFTISGAGRVAGVSVVRSSGVAAIDRAALRMVGGAAFPPPPGGRFVGQIPLRVK
jgi:protein TonB